MKSNKENNLKEYCFTRIAQCSGLIFAGKIHGVGTTPEEVLGQYVRDRTWPSHWGFIFQESFNQKWACLFQKDGRWLATYEYIQL